MIYILQDMADLWHKTTFLNAALRKSSGLSSDGVKFKDMPLWIRLRYKLWIYCRYEYWKTERPLMKKINEIHKRLGITL